MKNGFSALVVVFAFAFAGASSPALAAKKGEGTKAAAGKNPVVTIQTSMGSIKVELYPEKSPLTVKNFLTYVKEKHYDGTIFHRVIPDFMIQGGGMKADMSEKGGTHEPIKNEADNGLKNDTGTISMARTSDPNSATDQFFINVTDNAALNYPSNGGGYAVFGKVTDGMDIVKKIEHVKTTEHPPHANVPAETITIKSIRVVGK